MEMQYMSYWLDGNGEQHLMDPDLPLAEVKITRERDGIGRLTATLPPEYGTRTGYNDRYVIEEWATAIFVEIDGELFDSFIVAEAVDDNEKLQIDAVGWLGYASGQPWPSRDESIAHSHVRASFVISRIFEQLQDPEGANIGLKLDLGSGYPWVGDPNEEIPVPQPPGSPPVNKNWGKKHPTAPKKPSYPTSGTAAQKKKAYKKAMDAWAKKHAEYRQALGEWEAWEVVYKYAKIAYDKLWKKWEDAMKERSRIVDAAKIKMNYWTTHDLLREFQSLSEEAGFSYRVDHTRNGNNFTHTLYCRPGRLGTRREDIRFMEGENVYSVPEIAHLGDEKVTTAIVIGQGEGQRMMWRQISENAGGQWGLRRARVDVDKSLYRNPQLIARARQMLNPDPVDIEEFIVVDHDLAPIRSFDVGDEVRLQTFARRAGNLTRWVTILSISIDPAQGTVSVKVKPVDQE